MALLKLKDFNPNYREALGGNDIHGFSVYAEGANEKVGSVDELLVDEQGNFRYLVVDLGFWIFGKKVLLPVDRSQINFQEQRVYASGMTKEQAENLPEYKEDMASSYDYQEQVGGANPPPATQPLDTATPLEPMDVPYSSTEPSVSMPGTAAGQTSYGSMAEPATSMDRDPLASMGTSAHGYGAADDPLASMDTPTSMDTPYSTTEPSAMPGTAAGQTSYGSMAEPATSMGTSDIDTPYSTTEPSVSRPGTTGQPYGAADDPLASMGTSDIDTPYSTTEPSVSMPGTTAGQTSYGSMAEPATSMDRDPLASMGRSTQGYGAADPLASMDTPTSMDTPYSTTEPSVSTPGTTGQTYGAADDPLASMGTSARGAADDPLASMGRSTQGYGAADDPLASMDTPTSMDTPYSTTEPSVSTPGTAADQAGYGTMAESASIDVADPLASMGTSDIDTPYSMTEPSVSTPGTAAGQAGYGTMADLTAPMDTPEPVTAPAIPAPMDIPYSATEPSVSTPGTAADQASYPTQVAGPDSGSTVSGEFPSLKAASLLLDTIALQRSHGCKKVRVEIVLEDAGNQAVYQEWFDRCSDFMQRAE